MACASAAAFAGKVYAIREDQPRPGSNITRAIANSRTPLDKRYDELTPEELAVLRSEYKSLGPNDEPPYPKEGLKAIADYISRLEGILADSGEMKLAVRVDRNGQAQGVAVYKSPGPKMSKGVAFLLMKSDYKPAKCDGKPCDGEFLFELDFLGKE
jgi:hypothetical protein